MKKHILKNALVAVLLLISYTANSQIEIVQKKVFEHIRFLASDAMKGRKPGTPEIDKSAKYILDQFKSAGFKAIGEGGFQTFEVITNVEIGKQNQFSVAGYQAELKKDFQPILFSGNGNKNAEVVFAGYGFKINEDSLKWNDFSNLDVKDKWVLVFRGDPEMEKNDSKFIPYSKDRTKVLNAKDLGAAGILLVAGTSFEKEDKLPSFVASRVESPTDLPVIIITRAMADKILAQSGKTIAGLETQLIKERKPASFNTKQSITASSEIIFNKVKTKNVVAILEGTDPVLKNEYIVIGGHYDHLGMGGTGSGSRMTDTSAVHNGADDNASGIAGVIEIARKLASMKKNLKRSVVIIAFSGEEMGLLGSSYFVKNSLVPLKNIRMMLNLDMIGRLDSVTRYLLVSGSGTAAESEELLKKFNTKYNFSLSLSPDGFGSSDQSSFYVESIPVLFFNTGLHTDYHTPFDDVEKINQAGEKQICDFVYDLAYEFASGNQKITFRQVDSPVKTSGRGSLKVTLGIMPGFGGDEKNGLRVDGVRKGGPAEISGILKGDVIVGINGEKVANIYEYMDRLTKLKAGQVTSVDIVRGGKNMVIIVNL